MAKEPRAERLHFVGERDAAGQPLEYHAFVPARDLESEDIAGLTDEQYTTLTSAPHGHKPLFQKTRPASRAEPKADAKADAKAEPAPAPRRERVTEPAAGPVVVAEATHVGPAATGEQK